MPAIDDINWMDEAAGRQLKQPLPKSFNLPPRASVVERSMPKVYDPSGMQQTAQEVAKLAVDYSPVSVVADAIDAYEGGDPAKYAEAAAAIIPVPGAKLVKRVGNEFKNYGHVVDEVPIHWLRRLAGNDLRYDPAKLAEEIVAEGGLREPLIINVGKTSRTAQLGEGNHRLAALYRLGYDYAPARTTVGSTWGSSKIQPHGMAEDIIPVQGEYFSADALPSDVFRSLQQLSR